MVEVLIVRFAQYDGSPSRWVFHHPEGRGSAGAGSRITTPFRRQWDRVREVLGVEETRLHDLRHRQVTNWIAEGHGAELAGEAVGHADPKVTAHYTHLTRKHLRQLVEPEKSSRTG
ncbi:MAG TPA: tyrosine-type recombinase/integrase [Longimicrobiales bacterium]|nr:tyrosine-type recombinase/integrase [Longimicrobiales bacterium]